MVRYAIDNGVNYFDTAYPYHGGRSEVILGEALKDGYREKIILATKLPVWKVETYEDMEKILDEQLARLNTDIIDVYLFHALNAGTWGKLKKLRGLEFAEEMKRKGKIRYIGFSFHDEFDIFKEIIDSYDWDICQIQFNILDEDNQAGLEGLRYAGKCDIPVVIMEPLRGGNLATDIPDEIRRVWEDAGSERSPVDWAFRWIANFPEVLTILSGVSAMEQVIENIEIFSDMKACSMGENELNVVRRVQELYNARIKVPCTECRYCMPCPQGVSIPEIFEKYNYASMFEKWGGSRAWYKRLVNEEKDASRCAECGECEDKCPQKIPIIKKLKEADMQL